MALVTFVTFALVGLVLYAVLDRSGLIDSVQDVRDQALLGAEDNRIAAEIQATGTVQPREGRVRTIVVPAGSVVGIDPFDYEVSADSLSIGTDLSPQGLDPAIFDSSIIFFPVLNQQGWRAFDGYDEAFEPVQSDGFVALLAVTDQSLIGPLSISGVLLLAIPVGSTIFAVLFAAVAGTGLRPVKRMTTNAAEIQIGDLTRRLPDPRTGDELSDLAATINGMLDRVSDGVATERRFVADAAHELRSPIAASLALLEVSLGPAELDWRSTAGSVLDEQRRLAALVDDLVLLARLDDAGHGPVERVAFDDIVVSETSRPFVHMVDVRALGPAQLDADPRALTRVVRNLLSNADRHAATRIEVQLITDDATAVLHIDDDGSGVAIDDRSRIFDRFTRLDEARSRDSGGSGIGLAIVKEVTELYGGTAAVTESSLGGARFTVTLPLGASTSG